MADTGPVGDAADALAVPAHLQPTTHSYLVHYPSHPARKDDPHYVDFEHIHRLWKADPQRWQCDVGRHRSDFSECDLTQPLELHHFAVEFSLQNGIDLAWLEVDYPGVSDPNALGAWVESAANLEVLCVWHHRSQGGKHTAAYADWTGALYVKGLISK